jgi:hypothetical protein
VIAQPHGEVGRRVVSVGGGGETAKPGPLRTLMQAHEELVRSRPGGDASLAVWLGYYQRSVALYEQIAEIDPFHGWRPGIGRSGSDTALKRSWPGSGHSGHASNDGARRCQEGRCRSLS